MIQKKIITIQGVTKSHCV